VTALLVSTIDYRLDGTAGRNLRTRVCVDRSRSLITWTNQCYSVRSTFTLFARVARRSFPYIAKRSTGERNRIIMSTTITQEAYDEEIRELMEGLGMTEEEAIEDAVKCYEMKVRIPLFTPLVNQ